MQRFAKWHIWLGWLVGFPILMWTVSGLVMVARPIEEVRGTNLRTDLGPIPTETLALPRFDGPVQSVTLQNFSDGAGWLVVEEGGGRFRYDAQTGAFYNPVDEAQARSIAEANYAGGAALETMRYFPADSPPMDLRSGVNSWQAHFADGTNIYVLAQTGEVLAVRTRWWRIYDFFWGLHIMDLQTREDTHHPVLILFAALSMIGALLGCVLMFRRRKARPKAAQ